MLNHDDGVTQTHQTLENFEQLPHIVEVQPGGGFIEQIERAPGLAAAQLARQFDPLRLSSRERGRRLPQVDVAQPDVVQRLELGLDLRDVLEQRQRVFHGRIQQVGDGVPLYFTCSVSWL